MMKARDILFNTSWDELDLGTCKFFVPFFDQYISFILFQDHEPKPRITEKMILALNQIIELDKNKQEVFNKEFSNRELLKVREIHIDQENDVLNSIYSEIILDTNSNTYKSLIVKDGVIIEIDTAGTYLEALKKDT